MRKLTTFMKTLPVNTVLETKTTVTCDFTVPDGTRTAVFDIYNQRLKLYDITPEDYVRCLTGGTGQRPVGLPPVITKITVYARPGDAWIRHGFDHEATIRGFFADGTDAALWALYTDFGRSHDPRFDEHNLFTDIALAKHTITPGLPAEGYTCCQAGGNDADEIVSLLQAIFPDYPSPLTKEYIRKRIEKRGNHFRYIRDAEENTVASASAEIDLKNKNAEMTDCATLPAARGKGLMAYLLWILEKDLKELFGITDLYTFARADEVGINCVFSTLDYSYNGRLINNCHMPNGWESMNVWCKQSGGE